MITMAALQYYKLYAFFNNVILLFVGTYGYSEKVFICFFVSLNYRVKKSTVVQKISRKKETHLSNLEFEPTPTHTT